MVLKVNAGLFFRAEGGAAAAFGSSQGEGLPNISGSLSSVYTSVGSRANGAFSHSVVSYPYKMEGGEGNQRDSTVFFNASRSSAIYGASSHVTPVNSTIRVWKRTA